jgi:hypothetical protein
MCALVGRYAVWSKQCDGIEENDFFAMRDNLDAS